jgi:hypothetical protein
LEFQHREVTVVEKKQLGPICFLNASYRSNIFCCFFDILRAFPSIKSGSPWRANLQNIPLNIWRTLSSINSNSHCSFLYCENRRLNKHSKKFNYLQLDVLLQANSVIFFYSKPMDSQLPYILSLVRYRFRGCVTWNSSGVYILFQSLYFLRYVQPDNVSSVH